MATPYKFPWGLHPLEPWIKDEFDRRVREKDFNPTDAPSNTNPYSGGKTAWARVFSNGISSMADKDLQGFVMGGTEGFDESYGFTENGWITIGVDAYGKKHQIGTSTGEAIVNGKTEFFSDFPHRPPPSIVSLDTEFSGGSNSGFNALCRKTKITWKCYSLSQLEYLTPYFLTPRITVLAEWGWNHYDTISLVDLSDIDWLYGIFEGKAEYVSEWIEKSSGNYDLAMGFITDYGFTLNQFGGYDCFTTITNANYLIEGQSYQNKRTEKKDQKDPNKTIQLKDFTEFVFTDMNNLVIKNKPTDKKTVTEVLDIKTEGRVFKKDKDVWMKMDLVADIINKFFKVKFIDADGKDTKVGACELDIKNVTICAHPVIKAISQGGQILLPNQFAPRFVTKSDKVKSANNIKDAPLPVGEYYKLFPDIENVIKKYNFDESYDDIKSIINKSGRSFPMFEKYPYAEGAGPEPGYWGYLEDIFVSVEFFKVLVKKNETVLKLIEELIQHISEATCNICQLQCRPYERNSTRFTIIDSNFTPIHTVKDAESLLRITVGSVDSAFMKSADFGVKLSAEMSNQMVMQSASGKDLPEGYGTANYDPKTMEVSKFSRGDRMFDRGVIEKVTPSNNNEDNEKMKFKREYNPQNKAEFVWYESENHEKHILAEVDSGFLKGILLNTKDKRAIYANNGIMPGTTFSMELLGIGGITALSQFTLAHVPSSYSYERCVWQVSDVKQKIENKIWTTTITAQARPLTAIEYVSE